MNHKDRLKYPLIRKKGKLERASWDEAMDLIVQKAKSVTERLTAHGIAFYTSGQLFLEEYYALAVVGKAGLNTLHMYATGFAASSPESILTAEQGRKYSPLHCYSCSFNAGVFRFRRPACFVYGH